MPFKPVNDWENPQLVATNRLPMHASGVPYPDEAMALGRDPWLSPWVQSLDGDWQFHLAPNPQSLPGGFFEEKYDASSWDSIEVPGNWTNRLKFHSPVGIASNFGLPSRRVFVSRWE